MLELLLLRRHLLRRRLERRNAQVRLVKALPILLRDRIHRLQRRRILIKGVRITAKHLAKDLILELAKDL